MCPRAYIQCLAPCVHVVRAWPSASYPSSEEHGGWPHLPLKVYQPGAQEKQWFIQDTWVSGQNAGYGRLSQWSLTKNITLGFCDSEMNSSSTPSRTRSCTRSSWGVSCGHVCEHFLLPALLQRLRYSWTLWRLWKEIFIIFVSFNQLKEWESYF
jgi:hypothetical protein